VVTLDQPDKKQQEQQQRAVSRMTWWDNVKKSGLKTKLRGEIHLAEREGRTRKKQFGVELYDLLTNDKQTLLGVSAGTLFKGTQYEELKFALERSRDDIGAMQLRKDEKQKELDRLEIKGSHTMPSHTMGQKMSQAGKAVSDAGVSAKLKTQMALIDREMKIRKEFFGLEVFDLTRDTEEQRKGAVGSISSTISSMSDQEKGIQDVIDQAKNDVAAIEIKIRSKEREMGVIDEEMEPLSSSAD
jgi:hypothetical protein